ncbi:pyridoxal 5'-phosphate synthase glutaminase subunit PdxT [Succinivibrio sp.]|jgi:5'-phosphate synthase pdxT subunit|uniref:pyridoxal 5'-phosphate synthase glutaminase subunit PdxT n=1 Tax=Succinivibrio sp. TaxID=2053619 RepID=UPI00386D1220
MKIGVLAVQGAFIEHERMIQNLGAQTIELRQKDDLHNLDGLILPGGESTVQSLLLDKLEMKQLLKGLIEDGLPTLATCAGLILLAKNIDNAPKSHLATLPVSVKRNAFGRQLSSFVTKQNVGCVSDYPEVFIRAPYISSTEDGVETLCVHEDKIVGVKYKHQIGLAFHPELTDDTRIHQKFLELIAA